ncbi:hypothetical protein DRO97_02150 [Archaeoglobales archaeon]|nr:MAG: hypothetical protein DRO97_02150 [Archaeoglobales archaeon]
MYRTERIPEEGVEAYTKIAEFKGMEFFKEVAQLVAKSKPKLMLDVGTGPGILLAEVAKLIDGICIGIDCTRKFGEYVKLYAERYGVTNRVEFIAGNAYALPFKNCVFEVITSTGVLHDLKYPERFFEEIHRVLKPDGIALIKDPTPLRISDREAEKILNEEEMKVYKEYRSIEREILGGNEIPWTFSKEDVKLMLERINFKHEEIEKEGGVLSLYLVK